jgi:acyl-CoA thioester hydrolase
VSETADQWPRPDGLVFETFTRVRFHELDALGHVNNAAYLNYIEQAAIDHAAFLGLGMDEMLALGGVFVARRHEIDYLRPAHGGDVLRIATWLGEPRGARVHRSYLVLREAQPPPEISTTGRLAPRGDVPRDLPLIARARTEWVFVDGAGHPRRVPGEVIERFRSAPVLTSEADAVDHSVNRR